MTASTEAASAAATTGGAFSEGLVRLAHLVDQVFGEVGREQGLTPQQAQLLCVLIERPVGMTELSRSLHLERSSLSGLVDRVEGRGLVVRIRDERDRRAWRIALTPSGRDLGEVTHAEVVARLDRYAESVSAADRRVVAAVSDLMRAASTNP